MSITVKNLSLDELIELAKKQGISIEFVGNDKLHDYAGMHPYIARQLGIEMPDNTIWLDKNQEYETKRNNCIHELNEYAMMQKGKEYWPSHLNSLKAEKIENIEVPASDYDPKVKITHVHDDGDLTLDINGTPHVVTSENQAFKETQLDSEVKEAIDELRQESKNPVLVKLRNPKLKHGMSGNKDINNYKIGKVRKVGKSGMTRRTRTGKLMD